MKHSSVVFIDLGDEHSVCSTLYVANLAARTTSLSVKFYIDQRFAHYIAHFPDIEMEAIEVGETTRPVPGLVLDFTPIGQGHFSTRFYTPTTKYYSVDCHEAQSHQEFQTKLEFTQQHLGKKHLLSEDHSKSSSAVMTFSAQLAAYMNMLNIPTVEICEQGQRPGSFLPGSLVIKGDKFAVSDSDELQMIFEFYQQNKIEDLMKSRGVLEVDWQLIFFKQENFSVVSKNYPVTPSDDFFECFLKVFMSTQPTSKFSMDRLLEIAGRMDYIDFDTSADFLKKSLNLCIDDIEMENFPISGSYWNLVRNHIDLEIYQEPRKVLKLLNQALIGLDLFTRIEERQRRVVGLH